jgi:hypothetical protein
VGWAPGGPTRIADLVAQQEGFETELGGLQIAQGVFTGPGEITNRFICHRGDIDHGEVSRTRQPGQLRGVSAVGLDPIAGFLGIDEGATTQQL